MPNDTIEFLKIKDTRNVYYIRVERYEAMCNKNNFSEDSLDKSMFARKLLIQNSEYVVSIAENILIKSRSMVNTNSHDLIDVVCSDSDCSREKFMDKYVFSL